MQRTLTDEEVAHFREHGWLLARRLIEPDLARRLAPEGERILRESNYKPAGYADGSHRYGALGLSLQRPGDDTLSVHPWLLEELKLTDAPTLAPGDATFHHGLMVHGADINATNRARLAYQTLYCDAAAQYTGETV